MLNRKKKPVELPCGARRGATDEAGRIVQGGHPCGQRIWLCRLSWWGWYQDGLGSDGSSQRVHRQTQSVPSDSGLRPLPFRRGFYEAIQSLSKSRSGDGILHLGSWEATEELKDPKVATGASCHTPHLIRPPSDARSSVYPLRVADTCGSCHANAEYMASYKIPTDQLAKYKKSVHWKMMTSKGDLSAPTCNDCHGNHGAAPPGISWVGNVCGQCHPVNAELFNKSRHGQLFVQMGIPGCATCHSNHEILETSDAMLGVGDKAICGNCHTPQDTGGKTAVAMRETIERLRTDYESAHAILAKAENAGMEVSQPLFELNGAKTALVKARASIHGFNLDSVNAEVKPGLDISEKARARGIKALDELQFRRKGLVVSVLVILALVVGLILKIRQMERKP